jgi:hypothetical protein
MPTLPAAEDTPVSVTSRVAEAARRTGAAIGGGVSVRLLLLFTAAALGSSMAPIPWAQIALVALLGIAIDVARRRT